jgi:hypothetical protein
LIGGACLIVLMASGLFGQSAQPPRAFEVASGKPGTERSRALVADDVNVPSVTSFLSPTT